MKYFSTFTGIGGFELGILAADPTAECIGYSEIDKYAIKVYERQFNGIRPSKTQPDDSTDNQEPAPQLSGCPLHSPRTPNFGDITQINADTLPDFDLLVGGFPCQSFSIAGKRRGFEDTRGTLFFELVRIMRAKQPQFVVLENVKGLLSHDGGKTLDVILEQLQELGYYCNWEVHNSKDHGVPQNRERIILICKHIKGITSIGQNSKMTSYESLIQEYLFQLLLNNLAEVKKLQETTSKDSTLSSLIWREITESQEYINANISAGTTTAMDENKSPLPVEDQWQNIATWLSNELGVDCSQPNQSTISTVTNEITQSTTYTFSQMRQTIWLATVVLRSLQNNLWKQILLGLTVIQEGTKYARINNKAEEAIITESGTVHFSDIFQEHNDQFIKQHLRGTPRPEVFPIGLSNSQDTTEPGSESRGVAVDLTRREPTGYRVRKDGRAGTLDANYYKGVANQERPGVLVQLNHPKHSNDRVYGADGISPTLNTMQGGNRQPFVKVPEATKKGYAEATIGQAINLAQPNSKTRRGRVSDIANTLDTQQQQHTLTSDMRIRRLTPVECERLQGFPDFWTQYGTDTTNFVSYNMYGKIEVCKTSKLKNTSNVRLKIATDNAKQISGIALCTTSGGNDTGQSLRSYDEIIQGNRVSIVINRLENAEQTECVISITKCDDSTATPFTLRKSVANRDIADIFATETDSQFIEELSKKAWGENLTPQKLSTISTAIKQITDWLTSILLTDQTTLVSIELSPVSSEKGTIFQIYNLTEKHIESISDSSRYKMCGNAVTTNVIQAVMERLIDLTLNKENQ